MSLLLLLKSAAPQDFSASPALSGSGSLALSNIDPAPIPYTWGFENGTDGWDGPAFSIRSSPNVAPHSGQSAGALHSLNPGINDWAMTKVFNGLTVGRSYTFSAWLGNADAAGQPYSIGVVGIGATTGTLPLVVGPFFQASYTFVATSPSHTVSIGATLDQDTWLYVDDISGIMPYTGGPVPTYSQNWDGGTGAADGVTIATTNTNGLGNTAVDTVVVSGAGTIKFSSAVTHSGALSAKVTAPAVNDFAYATKNLTTTVGTRMVMRAYFNFTSVQTTAFWTAMALYSGTTGLLNFGHGNGNNNFWFRTGVSGTGTMYDTGLALTLNTWYRVEVGVTINSTAANSTFDYAIYAADSFAPLAAQSAIASSQLSTAAINVARISAGSTDPRTFYIDDWAFRSSLASGYLGPTLLDPNNVAGTATFSGDGALGAVGAAVFASNFTGSPPLSGSGSLAAPGIPGLRQAPSLTGSGTITGSAVTLNAAASPALTGVGALTALPVLAVPISTALTGSGTLGTAGLPGSVSVPQLSGSGQLASVNSVTALAFPAFTGSGVVAVPSSRPGATQVPQFTGGGAVTAVGVSVFLVSLQLAGSGVLTLTAAANAPTGAALSGAGVLAVPTTAPAVTVTVPLAGSGILTRLTSLLASGAPALSGSGALSSSANSGIPGAAAFSGAGSLTAIPATTATTAVPVSGNGSLSISGSPTGISPAAFTGAGSLALLSAEASASATALLSGSGGLATSAALTNSGTANFTGSGSLAAISAAQGAAQPTFSGSGALTDITTPALPTSGSIAANAATTATAISSPVTILNLSGDGVLGGGGLINAAPTVGFSGSGGLAPSAAITASSSTAFSGSGALSAPARLAISRPFGFYGFGGVLPGTITRTNWALDPHAQAGSWNSQTPTSSFQGFVAGTAQDSGYAFKITTNGGNQLRIRPFTGLDLQGNPLLTWGLAAPGDTITVSLDIYAPESIVGGIEFGYNTITNGTTYLVPSTTPLTVGWNRVSGSLTLPANARGDFGLMQFLTSTNVSSGLTWYASRVLVEKSATVGTYFDGATPRSGNLNYGWLGTGTNVALEYAAQTVPAVAVSVGLSGSGALTVPTRTPTVPVPGAFLGGGALVLGVDGRSWDFEDGTNQGFQAQGRWTPGISSTVSHSGKYSVLTTRNSALVGAGYVLANLTGVTGGGTYQFSAWVYASASTIYTVSIQPQLNGADLGGSRIGVVPVTPTANTWTQVVSTFTLPVAANGVGLYITDDNNNAPTLNSTLNIDDLTLARTGAPAISQVASLTGSGILLSASAGSGAAAPTFTGSGALVGSPKAAAAGLGAFSGSGTVSTAVSPTASAVLPLTGSGTLGTATTLATSAAATLSGSGALTTTASTARPGAATFSGLGSLALTAAATVASTVTLAGSGTLGTAGKVGVPTAAALSGSGTATVTVTPAVTTSLAVSGTGALAAASTARPTGSATLSGLGTLGVAATVTRRANAALAGSGGLSVWALPYTERFPGADGDAWPSVWRIQSGGGPADIRGGRGRLSPLPGSYEATRADFVGTPPLGDTDFSGIIDVAVTGLEQYVEIGLNGDAQGDFGSWEPFNTYNFQLMWTPPEWESPALLWWELYEGIDNTQNTKHGDAAVSNYDPTQPLRFRVQRIGQMLRARAWPANTPEPQGWQLVYEIVGTPKVGTPWVNVANGDDGLQRTVYFDDLTIAVPHASDAAPLAGTGGLTTGGTPRPITVAGFSGSGALSGSANTGVAVPGQVRVNAAISAEAASAVILTTTGRLDATTRISGATDTGAPVSAQAALSAETATAAAAVVQVGITAVASTVGATTGPVSADVSVTADSAVAAPVGIHTGISATAAFQLYRDTQFAILDMYGNPLRIGATLPGDRIYAQGESKQVGASTAGLTVTMRGNPLKVNGQF